MPVRLLCFLCLTTVVSAMSTATATATTPGTVDADAVAAAPTSQPDTDKPYSLVGLTDLALTNNPQTRIAWAHIRASQAGVELARAGYWPQISASDSLTRSRTVNFTGATNSAQTRNAPSISLSYLLWDFGTRAGTVDAAKFSLAAAELSRNQIVQDLILAVEQDYYQVLGLRAIAQADALSVKDAATSLDAARQNQKAGLRTVGDVYQAEAALAGAQLVLQQTRGALAVAQGTLAVAAGLTADTSLPLAPWDAHMTADMPETSVTTLLEQARQARPELLAARASERVAIANLEATRGRGLPTLALAASAGRTHTQGGGASQNADNYSAGLNLSIPLFAGFGDRAAIRQARAAIDLSQATTAQLVKEVELEVWQAYQNLHTAHISLSTADAQLKSASQAQDAEQARYHIGLDAILNLLTTQTTLANARAQQVQARLNWFTALAALGHAVGGLDAPGDTQESP